MKTALVFFLAISFFAFAAEKYGVYDLQGNCVSTFEAESGDLLSKIQQIKSENPQKSLYVSSLSKSKSSKPTSRYRYKTEIGAYIEASRKETFSVCPDKEIQGTWISEHSVYLNEANCLSVRAHSRYCSWKTAVARTQSRFWWSKAIYKWEIGRIKYLLLIAMR